jgi:hypothetical protein
VIYGVCQRNSNGIGCRNPRKSETFKQDADRNPVELNISCSGVNPAPVSGSFASKSVAIIVLC